MDYGVVHGYELCHLSDAIVASPGKHCKNRSIYWLLAKEAKLVPETWS